MPHPLSKIVQIHKAHPVNHFGLVQIMKSSPKKANLNAIKMMWTQHELFVPDQNNFYPSKTIWMVQNHFWTVQIHFGPIEGHGISIMQLRYY